MVKIICTIILLICMLANLLTMLWSAKEYKKMDKELRELQKRDEEEQTTACLNPEKLNEVKQEFKQDLNKDDEMFGDYMSPIV